MSDGHDIKKEVKKYYLVFTALIVLTVVTVALSNFHMGVGLAIFLGLLVATTKASLVASIFMHLISERKIIYVVLGMTMVFFVSMILLIIAGKYSLPERTTYLHSEKIDNTVHSNHGQGELQDDHKEEGGHH